jgi:hypothetical protein
MRVTCADDKDVDVMLLSIFLSFAEVLLCCKIICVVNLSACVDWLLILRVSDHRNKTLILISFKKFIVL